MIVINGKEIVDGAAITPELIASLSGEDRTLLSIIAADINEGRIMNEYGPMIRKEVCDWLKEIWAEIDDDFIAAHPDLINSLVEEVVETYDDELDADPYGDDLAYRITNVIERNAAEVTDAIEDGPDNDDFNDIEEDEEEEER